MNESVVFFYFQYVLVNWIYKSRVVLLEQIGSLSKPRRRLQRERHQTKGLISKTIAVHVRYNYLYISMASSA